MKTLTRRSLLTSSALGAAGVVLGASVIGAASGAMASSVEHSLSDGHASCAHNHHALGHKLSTLIADPAVDDMVKNHAIKTASCPSCGTGIAPTGLGLAVSTWI